MSLIVAIIIGGVIGWLASLIMKTNAQRGPDREHRGGPGAPGARRIVTPLTSG